MAQDNRLYIRILPLDGEMSWGDVARVVQTISPDADMERHDRGGFSVWLPKGIDRSAMATTLEAAGLQIVI